VGSFFGGPQIFFGGGNGFTFWERGELKGFFQEEKEEKLRKEFFGVADQFFEQGPLEKGAHF
jgi:hypothetical protein